MLLIQMLRNLLVIFDRFVRSQKHGLSLCYGEG
jgi:hypothetical protein